MRTIAKPKSVRLEQKDRTEPKKQSQSVSQERKIEIYEVVDDGRFALPSLEKAAHMLTTATPTNTRLANNVRDSETR